jgi:signal transduction histidine kinase
MNFADLSPIEFALSLSVVSSVVTAGVAFWLGRRPVRRATPPPETVQAALDRALDKIRDFATSQGRFVATLAAELRSPLATARLHAELLVESGTEPATVERYAHSMVEELRHLDSLVESFLHLAQPMAQQDTSRHVPVHVHDVVLAAVRRSRFAASARGVVIAPTLAETRDGAQPEVLGDPVLLEAMLDNLVRNAVLASPRGARVDLRVRLIGDDVHVAVHDMGPPIPPDRLDEVFHGFFHWPEPMRSPLSSGLGLSIAMRVAEHHRGTISLVDGPEGGCRLEVQLPRWRGEALPRN